MIFVTVGTHEQPFDRLVRAVDELVAGGMIAEEVFIQTGYSTYEPKHCTFSKMLPFGEMVSKVAQARIVITHGGPSSFIMPLQVGKTPIVVPRQARFDEHVNDHQLEFAGEVARRHGNILVVEDIATLGAVIADYDGLAAKTGSGMHSNNAAFMQEFEKIVQELCG